MHISEFQLELKCNYLSPEREKFASELHLSSVHLFFFDIIQMWQVYAIVLKI